MLTFSVVARADEQSVDFKFSFKRPQSISYPESNPYSSDRELLGKMLFFDPRLSGSNVTSCATCHNPSFGWSDGLTKAVGHGHKTLSRKTPTLLNMAWGIRFFWDGRAESLEEQALFPIQAKEEMNQDMHQLVVELKGIKGYVDLFEKSFPGEGVTAQNISKAIATFERSIVSAQAPFDRWISGEDNAISDDAKKGFFLFNTKAQCSKCHGSWNFTDGSFHDIGLADGDRGRGKILPRLQLMQHAFKTPTLRNIVDRAPYMHDGSERTLRSIIEFYNRGGKVRRKSLSEFIQPLNLTDAEMSQLVEFLNTLSSDDTPVSLPKLPL